MRKLWQPIEIPIRFRKESCPNFTLYINRLHVKSWQETRELRRQSEVVLRFTADNNPSMQERNLKMTP